MQLYNELLIVNHTNYDINISYDCKHGNDLSDQRLVARNSLRITTTDKNFALAGSEGIFTLTLTGVFEDKESAVIKFSMCCSLTADGNYFKFEKLSPFVRFKVTYGNSVPDGSHVEWGQDSVPTGGHPLGAYIHIFEEFPPDKLSLITYNTHLFSGSMATVGATVTGKTIVIYDEERKNKLIANIIAEKPTIVCLQEVWGAEMQKTVALELSKTYPYVYIVPDVGFTGTDWELALTGGALGVIAIPVAFFLIPGGLILSPVAGFLAGLFGGSSLRNEITNTSGLIIASEYLLSYPRYEMYTRDNPSIIDEESWAKKAIVAFDINIPVSERKYAKITLGTTHAFSDPADADKAIKTAAKFTFNDRNNDALLAGDFNIHVKNSDEYRKLKETMDTYKAEDVVQRLVKVDDYTTWAERNRLSQLLGCKEGKQDRIDYVYFAPGLKDSHLQESFAKVFHDWNVTVNNVENLDLSDHYPVYVEFKFK